MLALFAWASVTLPLTALTATEAELRPQVEADWRAQEQRLGREPGQAAAIRAALERGRKLLASLRDPIGPRFQVPNFPGTATLRCWRRWKARCPGSKGWRPPPGSDLYHRVRWATRDLALRNPLLAGQPLVFLKRHRFICQMLHEYLGYFYDYGDVAGGGVSCARGTRPVLRDAAT